MRAYLIAACGIYGENLMVPLMTIYWVPVMIQSTLVHLLQGGYH